MEQPEDVIELLLKEYGDYAWFYDAVETRDDCGLRLEIQVVRDLYIDDLLPRKIGHMYCVVVKVDV
jgi:hypothetical protein